MEVCKTMCSEIWRESQFKIKHRAYSTFFYKGYKPYKRQKQYTLICPECNTPKPTLTHCLWECARLHTFWLKVRQYMQEVTRTEIPMGKTLFHITPPWRERPTVHQQNHKDWIIICLLTLRPRDAY